MTEELWTVRGGKPVVWQIPVYVTWNEDGPEGAVFPSVPLLRIQQKAFDELMVSRARKVNGLWMIIRSELRRVAKPAKSGSDPETLLAWERTRMDQNPSNQPEKREERDAFINALYLNGAGKSRDDVAHWWFLFCDHALDWLINKERPIDMFFLRLTPLPFRPNWIERTEKQRHNCRGNKNFLTPERFGAWMNDGKLLGVNSDGTISRHVALEHLPLWWKTIKRVESTRIQSLNPARYAAAVIDSVLHAIPAATRIYRNWLVNKSLATAVYVEGRSPGSSRFEACPSPSRRPTPLWGTSDKYRHALWILKPEKVRELSRKSKALSRKNGKLPAVSDIQPQGQDVRDGGNAG